MANRRSDARPQLQAMGTACVVSGGLGLVAGVVTLAYPAAVPEEQWSYPFTFAVGLAMGVGLAITHVLTLLGVRALQLTVADEGRRAAQAGLWVALTGFALLAGCELASGLIGRAALEDAGAQGLSSAFGVASLMTAMGSIIAGAVIRRGRAAAAAPWLLASGIAMIVLVTPANISGNPTFRMVALMLWSLCFVGLGLAVRRLPARTPSAVRATRNGGIFAE